jgi:hypothetical protein
MPNHVENDLLIQGKIEDVQKVLDCIKTSESIFDFNTLIPYPSRYLEADKIKEGSGFNSGGYNWCVENWGTKWNAYEIQLENLPTTKRIQKRVLVSFLTAWSPPEPVIEELALKFPLVDIKLSYYESGQAFQGKIVYKKGLLQTKVEKEYRGNRGG